MSCKSEFYIPVLEKPLCNCNDAPTSDNSTLKEFCGGILPQNYAGDFILTGGYQASATCRVGDTIYCLAQKSNSNTGKLLGFSVSGNNKIIDKNIVMGHGNGFCYSAADNAFYIAPVFNQESNVETRWYSILKYNADFTSYVEIPTNGISIMSVSYNWETGVTYAYSYNHKIYYLSGNTLKEFKSVTMPLYNYDINQGFAVNGEYFILTSPRNNMLIGKLATGEIEVEKMLDVRDYSKKYYLGESEDLEFAEDGTLYCINSIYLDSTTHNITNGIVTEIVYKSLLNKSFYIYWPVNGRYSLTDSTAAKFKNTDIEIKHPMQINYMVYHDVVNTITIDCHTDFGSVYFNVPVTIDLKGAFYFTRIKTVKDLVFINDSNAYFSQMCITNATGADIWLDRGAKLWLCDSFQYVNTDTSVGNYLKVIFGNSKSLISVRSKYQVRERTTAGQFIDTTVMQIGDDEQVKEDARGLWWGSKLVTGIE